MASEWDKFPAASPLDAALAAEGVSSDVAGIARSIYEQESGSGRNTKTSNAGAVGGMQIIPSTFKSVADREWDINNPEHNARAGVRYIAQLHERSGENPELTAAGYYGGPGGMEKAKKGIAVSDPRNPKAPTTLQYAKQVVNRMEKTKSSDDTASSWDQFPAVEEDRQKEPEKQVSESKPESRSTIDEVGRQVGLTVRHGLAGVLSPVVMGADAIAGLANDGLDAVRGDGNGYRFPKQTAALQRGLSAIGLPEPENATERVVGDVTSAMAGAGSMIKGAEKISNAASSQVTKAVANAMAKGKGTQIVSAATGSGAAGATREGGGSQEAQIVAGVLGSLAPGVIPFAKDATWRGVMRGGEAGRKKVAENIELFKKAGTTPTVGQATESRVMRGAESALAKIPGGAGVIAKRAQQQADEMSAAVQKLSDELAPDASAVNAGEAISRGVRSFKDGFKTIQTKLYDDLDQHIPTTTPISVTKTQEALKALNADIPGAPNLSEWFKNSKIKGIDKALQADLEAAAKAAADGADGTLPYVAIKKLRTLVGNEIADNSLMSDVPRSKWKALYGALSEDLGTAVKTAGPKAEESWNWANTFTKKQLERLDQLSGIVAKDAPEKVFRAAVSGTSEGDTVIKRVINALPKQERREVAAAVIQRLGRATPGQQNAVGDAFSSETFLTNISKISPSARKTLFGRTDIKGIEDQIGNFAKIAESRRDGGRVFANPSGTSSGMAQLGAASSVGAGLASMNPALVLGPAAAGVAANALARHLTNPATVRELAKTATLNPGTIPAAVGAAIRTGQTTPATAEEDWSQFPEAAGDAEAPAAPQQAQEQPGQVGLKTHDGYPARNNADGSVSTELSITVTDPRINGGRPTNIPSLWEGEELQEGDAVEKALMSGREFSSFNSVEDAVDAARTRSEQGGASVDAPAQVDDTKAQESEDISMDIQRLRDSGEPDVADVLQARYERRQAIANVDREVGYLQQSLDDPIAADPVFHAAYKEMRVAGLKPADAAGRASIGLALGSVAQDAGVPEKAINAIMAKSREMPLDKVPGFVARAFDGLSKNGLMPAYQGDISTQLDDIWERAATTAMRSVYRNTSNEQNAPQPAGETGEFTQAAPVEAAAPARGDAADTAGLPGTGRAGDAQAAGVSAPDGRIQVSQMGQQPAMMEPQQDAPQEAAPAAVDTAAAEAQGLSGAGVDGVDQPGAVPELNTGWSPFPEQTGTLNVPRAEMPQVKTAHRGPLTNFLNARGVTHEQVEVDPAELKPTQAEFSQTKVQEAADRDTDRSILISADGHIIDGHHQALAKLENGKPVRAIRLNATAADLIPLVREFPSSTTEKAAIEGEDVQDVEASVRPDGTLAIKGDKAVLKDLLAAAGIPVRSIIPMTGGLLVGKTQAEKAWVLLQG